MSNLDCDKNQDKFRLIWPIWYYMRFCSDPFWKSQLVGADVSISAYPVKYMKIKVCWMYAWSLETMQIKLFERCTFYDRKSRWQVDLVGFNIKKTIHQNKNKYNIINKQKKRKDYNIIQLSGKLCYSILFVYAPLYWMMINYFLLEHLVFFWCCTLFLWF